MGREVDPSLNRRRLRVELRRAREAAGLTQRDAALTMEWSLSKLIRIEAGTVSVSVTDLRALLHQYDVTDAALVADLEDAARGSKGQSWWASYSDMINPQFAQYLGYETSATTIQAFSPVAFPALLQSDDYATALLAGQASDTTVRRAVELRMSRQEQAFDESEGPQVHFIVDESVFRRHVGGSSVMRRQLQFVKERAQHPRVTLQLLPFTAGAFYGTTSPFVLLAFKDDDDLLYLESATGSTTSRDDLSLIARYQESFAEISSAAYSGDRAIALIDEIYAAMQAV
ncbi:helix-turn-helix domain-containing protein [Streptomyces sp. NPDC102340]|uniref:helix-turn-helix domain-containing protein n=1 Tax=unclassified Streptomyces TaxID=2593676 RepID=UPI0037FEEFBD